MPPHRIVVAALLIAPSTSACSLVGAGAKATHDGSAIVGSTMDSMWIPMDLRLVRVPAMSHPPAAQRPVYNDALHHGYPRFVSADRGPAYAPQTNQSVSTPLGYIPQVNSTYAYWDVSHGMQNEVQLSIGESTCAAKTVGYPLDMPNGHNLFSINELSRIALERCDSAVCAVKTMGALAEEYGFYAEYSTDPLKPRYGASAEALIVADKHQNVWIFHILTGPHNSGAIWAAQRLGDDQFTIVPNTFVIRTLNLTDSDNYLASSNVHSFAYAQGWASPETEFDFTSAYGYAAPASSKPLYGGRRMWRAFSIVAPSVQLDPDVGFHARVRTYPLSVKPDGLISPQTIMHLFGDYYENTTFDLTKGVAAGPFHDPVRYSNVMNVTGGWERAFSIHRTVHSFVLQTRPHLPDAIGGIAWYGQGVPADTVYFPISCGQNSLPTVFNQALRTKFDSDSTWWAFHFTSNWAHLRYDVIHPIVESERSKYRGTAVDLHTTTEAACRERNATIEGCVALLESAYNNFIVNTTKAWWAFAWHLVSTFNAGYQYFNESSTGGRNVGYSPDWANLTDYVLYPQHYHPPAQVAAEVNRTAAVDAETGELPIAVGAVRTIATIETHPLSKSAVFVLGMGCGAVGVCLAVAVVALGRRLAAQPPTVDNSVVFDENSPSCSCAHDTQRSPTACSKGCAA